MIAKLKVFCFKIYIVIITWSSFRHFTCLWLFIMQKMHISNAKLALVLSSKSAKEAPKLTITFCRGVFILTCMPNIGAGK